MLEQNNPVDAIRAALQGNQQPTQQVQNEGQNENQGQNAESTTEQENPIGENVQKPINEEEVNSEEQENLDYFLEVDIKGNKKPLTKAETEKLVREALVGEYQQSKITKEFQKLAEEKKVYQEQQAKLAQEAEFVIQAKENLEFLTQAYSKPPVTNQELQTLLDEGDVEGFNKAKFQLDNWQNAKNAIEYQKAQLHEYESRKQQEAYQAQLEYGRKILQEQYPQVLDKATEINQYLLDKGYSQEELNQVTDYRVFTAVYDALQYHQLKKKASDVKVNPTAPKSIKSGSPVNSSTQVQKKQALESAKTGRIDDVSRYISTLLKTK